MTHKRNKFLISDIETPITLAQINEEINNPETDPEQVAYLMEVLETAKKVVEQVGQSISDVNFRLQANGDILPFGMRPIYWDELQEYINAHPNMPVIERTYSSYRKDFTDFIKANAGDPKIDVLFKNKSTPAAI